MAAVVENSHDELGIVWPREIAPFDVHVLATGKDEVAFEAADALVAELEAGGVEVLYDDRRKVSPGVKFKDAELLGMPTIVVVGKGLADGVVEVRDRATGERSDVPVAEAAERRARRLPLGRAQSSPGKARTGAPQSRAASAARRSPDIANRRPSTSAPPNSRRRRRGADPPASRRRRHSRRSDRS